MQHNRFLIAGLFVSVIVVSLGLVVIAPSFAGERSDYGPEMYRVAEGVLLQQPPRQDFPVPQLCRPEEPKLTPLTEAASWEVSEDGTIWTVTYENEIGQVFVLTLRSPDAETAQAYFENMRVCLEAASADGVFSDDMAADIPLGDAFIDVLREALAEVDIELSTLVQVREERSREAMSEDKPGPTLRELLVEFGLDESTIQTIPDNAAAIANELINTAVEDKRLSPERAEELRGTVEEMYGNSLDEPDAPIVPGLIPDMEAQPDPELLVDVKLEAPGDVEAETYVIFSVFDPTIYYSWDRRHEYTYSSATWVNATVTVTGGRVSAYLYSGSNYLWSRTKTYVPGGNNDMSSGWWKANRLVLHGWYSTNSYSCACYPLQRTR